MAVQRRPERVFPWGRSQTSRGRSSHLMPRALLMSWALLFCHHEGAGGDEDGRTDELRQDLRSCCSPNAADHDDVDHLDDLDNLDDLDHLDDVGVVALGWELAAGGETCSPLSPAREEEVEEPQGPQEWQGCQDHQGSRDVRTLDRAEGGHELRSGPQYEHHHGFIEVHRDHQVSTLLDQAPGPASELHQPARSISRYLHNEEVAR